MKKRKLQADLVFTMALMALAAVGITVTGILYEQDFWRMLPLYFSLGILLLNSRVSRLAPLAGACNSLLYVLVYFSYGLYASAANTLLVSMPLQLVTFLRWNKNAYKQTTVFRRLTSRQRIDVAASFAAAWGALYLVMSALGSSYMLIDNTTALVGILATVLMLLAYVEYTPLMLVSELCHLVLYITMLAQNPEQITYVIFTVYSAVCRIIAVIQAGKTYREQQTIQK